MGNFRNLYNCESCIALYCFISKAAANLFDIYYELIALRFQFFFFFVEGVILYFELILFYFNCKIVKCRSFLAN